MKHCAYKQYIVFAFMVHLFSRLPGDGTCLDFKQMQNLQIASHMRVCVSRFITNCQFTINCLSLFPDLK